MPVRNEREYRAMALLGRPGGEKRIQSDFYVEGYATTFDDPYLLCEDGGVQYFEEIVTGALDGADLSDVIMQYDHAGRVYARRKNGSLIAEPDRHGLFVAADLSLTEGARSLYRDIDCGLIDTMSWAFTVAADEYINTPGRILRRILKIKRIYDVSAVSIPANPGTDIHTRGWIGGAIETANAERRARKKLKLILDLEGFTHHEQD